MPAERKRDSKINSPMLTSLLRQENFGSVPQMLDWKGTGNITPYWRTESKPSVLGSGTQAQIDDKLELSFVWNGDDIERVRLLQFLSHETLEPSRSGYEVHLQATFSDRSEPHATIEWIAILVEQSDGKTLKFYKKLPLTTIRIGSKITVLTMIHVKEFEPNKRYALCFQFFGSARQVSIRNVQLTAAPAQEAVPMEPQAVISRNADSPRKHAPVVSAVLPIIPSSAYITRVVPAPATGTSHRKRAVVIAWDMGHNPVGRAFLLADVLRASYDVTLIGPLFDRYGDKVWGPLSRSGIAIHAFPAKHLGEFVEAAIEFVSQIEADVVYACKARLPSILLGLLIKHRTGCPLVLDVDDHELSFFLNRQPITTEELTDQLVALPDLNEPYSESWTRVCESIIPMFDALTVSNIALQGRFGGTIVRHARDEAIFARSLNVRDAVRKEFGYSDLDRVILFLGTPRAHKGIFRIAEALDRINDPRLALCIIGSVNDKRIESRLMGYRNARIKLFPDQAWERLPELINLADGVCLLQDPESPVSEYQAPAKLTDALATGIPVAVTDVAPFGDLPSDVATKIYSDADLEHFLISVANGDPTQAGSTDRVRSYFLAELSYATALKKLQTVFDTALTKSQVWPQAFSDLLALVSRRTGVSLPCERPNWLAGECAAPLVRRERPIDLAFFWKQNDTGLYGRRHDMLIKYLSEHPRVGRIVQFDAPMDVSQLERSRFDRDAFLDQRNLVIANTLARFLRTADRGNVHRRVFVHRNRQREKDFLGMAMPDPGEYVDWVRRTLREVAPEQNFISWVTPVVFDYPTIHDEIPFRGSVADIIDDQRAMGSNPEHARLLADAYKAILGRTNIAIANCTAAANAFSDIRQDIIVVPNAAEMLSPRGDSNQVPHQFEALKRPIIGYVGNLRDRLDTDLLAKMSRERPSWTIALIGSAHGNPDILRLRGLPNVHFLGVKPYEEALQHIRTFDVAIMPHLDNKVSAAMNPLKLYVYCALGVPVVTTAVSNIGEMAQYIRIASHADDFIACVDEALANPKGRDDRAAFVMPYNSSWNSRVDKIMESLEKLAA